MEQARLYYESDYRERGFSAQRMYPNEELLRFMGSYYFQLPWEQRRKLRALEVGCGSGANLWMIAREGFEAYGLDLSDEALKLCYQMLEKWACIASLKQGNMTSIPYDHSFFHLVVDVFSAYCMTEREFEHFLDEVTRVLKPGGRFFSYTPSKNSDAFRNPGPARFIDASTLDGIRRETSPYYGQDYPCRFIAPEEFAAKLEARGFKVLRNERIGRTYRNMAEYFEFVSMHAERCN